LTAAATAVAGPVAFAGLIVPHLARLVVGTAHVRLLLACLLLGPVLVLAADVLGRVVAPPGEIGVGVMTALVGAPVLVLLVRRRGAVEL
ncbi:MAG: iron chelate uptake ABC transporter family permease subunit, partial [Actinomycetaceae bacterium]